METTLNIKADPLYLRHLEKERDDILQRQLQSAQLAGVTQQAIGDCANSAYRPSLKEQSEKATIHHREQLDKHAKAAKNIAAHPEFDEFIQLIRSGVIQI